MSSNVVCIKMVIGSGLLVYQLLFLFFIFYFSYQEKILKDNDVNLIC